MFGTFANKLSLLYGHYGRFLYLFLLLFLIGIHLTFYNQIFNSESSGKATTSLSTPAILSFILSFLQPNDSIPTSLVIISAQTLATITEENKEINKHFTEAYLEGLHDIVSGKQVFSSIPEDVRPQLRILCAGSLYNLRKLLPNGSEIYKLATPAIEVALNIPYKSFVDAVIAKPIDSAEPNANEEDNEAMMEEDPSHQEHILEAQQHSSDFTQIKEYKQFETQMSTVQFALELLTNICSSEEFEEESDDGEWGDVKEEEEEVTPAAAAEEDDAIMEAEMDNPAAEDEELQDLIALSSSASTPAPTSDISETNLHHLTTNLFPRLLELAAPVTNIPETHKQYLTTSTSLITLRSLECLNNCLLQFPVTWFQEFNIVELWNWCFNLASSMNLETLETEVVDAFLGVLAGIAKGSDKAGKKIMASPETVTPLLNLPWTLATSSITKLINLLSILGKSPCPVDINRQIGTFLMTNILRIVNAAPGTSSLSIVDSVDIVSEILDGIFDIYGDETYDYDQGVFFKDGYLDKLANVSMKMRVAVKNVDKRRHRMVREKADLALINLRGFLQYKNGEYKKLGLL